MCSPVVAMLFDIHAEKMKEKILKLHSPSNKELRKMTSGSGGLSKLTVIRTKDARRRRLKCTCQTNISITGNSSNVGDNNDKNLLLHGSKPNNGLTELSLSLSSSSSSSSKQSSSEENDIVLAGFGEKTCNKNDDVQSLTCTTSHGLLSVIGRRREMEDAVKVELGFMVKGGEKFDFYGVYDGHGGSRVAEECKERLHKVLVEEIVEDNKEENGVDWGITMERCFEKMDEEVNRETLGEEMVGSTAVVAMVGDGKLVVANCGDSRAVLSRGGVAVALSFDHKPDRPDELERIESAGGRVINWNGHRVLGVLATSRSIGDQCLKPFVICKPEVTVKELTNRDEFLILASDGLWDVISNEVACRVVRRCLNGRIRRKSLENIVNENRAAEAAAMLVELAIVRGSKDNISVIVVELRKT